MEQQTEENVGAPTDKKSMVDAAKLAEQAERYEDMVASMKAVAQLEEPLSSEERNLLSVAYKNVVGTRRSSWRIIFSIQQKEKDDKKQIALDYLHEISSEIKKTCTEVVDLIDKHLLKDNDAAEDGDKESESKTFYLKMKGDYYRYVAEVTDGDEKDAFADNAAAAYKEASDLCCTKMKPTHPIRLGLSLNYSVFFYEIQGKRQDACKIAKEAFDEAIKEMEDGSNSSNFKDSTLIMQLLRDNLTLWDAANAEADEDEPQEEPEQEAAAE